MGGVGFLIQADITGATLRATPTEGNDTFRIASTELVESFALDGLGGEDTIVVTGGGAALIGSQVVNIERVELESGTQLSFGNESPPTIIGSGAPSRSMPCSVGEKLPSASCTIRPGSRIAGRR